LTAGCGRARSTGALYAESQTACNAYKAQNDDLVRQLTSLMRRMSPTSSPARENETESAVKRGDDVEKSRQSSWLLDFTEERENDASLTSSSVVNINSSLSDDSLHRGHHDDGVTPGAAALPTQVNSSTLHLCLTYSFNNNCQTAVVHKTKIKIEIEVNIHADIAFL